ncbi:DUF5682 family protein [Kribbella sancticallisti]|uniref:DUF5682 family protein n=1 Tax=Kribbella sancticallisti TaxID=460087 RepID=A0ABN2DVQ5_9ACTN
MPTPQQLIDSALPYESGQGVTADWVRGVAGKLVSEELVVMPVRHHSPACAVQVRRMIEECRPSVVLVEGPREFSSLVPLLTHPDARMPLAVYSYAVQSTPEGEHRWAGYYPFCDYSPELVALRDAVARGIPARFIDLDFSEQHLAAQEASSQPEGGGAAVQDELEPSGQEGESLLDERYFRHSKALQLLAERLGCRDDEDLWELLFEADAATTPAIEHLERVTAYCLLARNDHTGVDLVADGTAAREAEMAWHISEAVRERQPGSGPVLAVVGGFHAVALPALLTEQPPRPEIPTQDITADSALIRYSFERLERLNGYSAGMTSPAWHQRLWEQLTGTSAEDPRTTALLATLLDIAQELRVHHKVPLAVATVAAAFEQALRLADLRDRPAPLRSDMLDAVASCFVKGDIDVEGLRVRAAARRTLTGEAIGVVPPGAGTPPLVHDALERLRRQRLRVDSMDRQTTSLDIYRSAAHRETSRLLHGIAFLGVPFATRLGGPDFVRGTGLGRLQERWDYHWSPVSEGALVEASVLGSTVPSAVAVKFDALLAVHRQSQERADSTSAVSLVSQACVLGLHDQVAATLDLARESLAADASFVGVAAAVTRLALLWEAREPLDARRLDELPALLRTAYRRVMYLGRELEAGDDSGVTQALVQLRELLVGEAGQELDADLYWSLLEQVHVEHESPYVRGAATGVMYSAGRLGSVELAGRVSGQLAGGVPPGDAVGFLGGLLATAREAAWQEGELLAGLDRRVSSWDEATFIRHLPDLRLAFAELTPVETDRVGKAVAGLHGVANLGPLIQRNTTEQEVQRNLVLSATVAELLRHDGLGAWSGA